MNPKRGTLTLSMRLVPSLVIAALLGCGGGKEGTVAGGSGGSGGNGAGATSSSSGASTTSSSSGSGGAGGGGLCAGVTCTASDACHLAGTCDPATGKCSDPAASDGTACDDGIACTQTDTCQAGVCTGTNLVKGALDQAQLNSNGGDYVTSSQSVGQTFVAGKTGSLTGIEVSFAACPPLPPGGSIRLDLRDQSHTVLTSATISVASLPPSCSSGPLSSMMIGPGFFDLSSACIPVTAGEPLEFEAFAVGFPPGKCDLNTLKCTSGGTIGSSCLSDSNCEAYRVVASVDTSGPYPQGTEFVSGGPIPQSDLAFKTFVH